MSLTAIGMSLGLALAAIALNWGFGGFLLAVLFMLVGAVLGRAATGKLDLRGVGLALIGKNTTESD